MKIELEDHQEPKKSCSGPPPSKRGYRQNPAGQNPARQKSRQKRTQSCRDNIIIFYCLLVDLRCINYTVIDYSCYTDIYLLVCLFVSWFIYLFISLFHYLFINYLCWLLTIVRADVYFPYDMSCLLYNIYMLQFAIECIGFVYNVQKNDVYTHILIPL